MGEIDYKPYPIDDLIELGRLPFDISIRLPNAKLVLIGRRGDQIDLRRLNRYNSLGTPYILVKADDLLNFKARSTTGHYESQPSARVGVGVGVGEDNGSENEKSSLLTACDSVFQYLILMGIDTEVIDFSLAATKRSIRLIESNPDLMKLLRSLGVLDDGYLDHGIAVGAVSVMVARSQGWTHHSNFDKLCVGGILHDIGIRMLPSVIQKKREEELSNYEREIYQSHPTLGYQALGRIRGIPKEVLCIAREHHEANGLGFPRKLQNGEVHPMARLTALADRFCYLTIGLNSHSQAQRSLSMEAHEGLALIDKKYKTQYKDEDLTALIKTVGVVTFKECS
jgi:hypothetical protein